MDTDVERRLTRLEAHEDIRQLVARYGIAVDDRDMETVGSLFTADAVFRHGDNSLVNDGRQEIVDFYTDRLRSFAQWPTSGSANTRSWPAPRASPPRSCRANS